MQQVGNRWDFDGSTMIAPTELLRSGEPVCVSVRSFRSVWVQLWRDVLFLHWRVPIESLRTNLPPDLEIDTFGGDAWLSAVLFRLKVRPCGLPFLPLLSTLVEVNLRTYVTCRGVPGIYFLSIHADNRPAAAVAKLFTPLPYRHAKLAYRCEVDAGQFDSAMLKASFHTETGEAATEVGSLDEFLLERYRLYAPNRRGALLQAEVRHPRWRTQRVEVSLERCRLGEEFGLELSRAPDESYFSAGVPALFGRFQRIV